MGRVTYFTDDNRTSAPNHLCNKVRLLTIHVTTEESACKPA